MDESEVFSVLGFRREHARHCLKREVSDKEKLRKFSAFLKEVVRT
jgi:hypothetical protein